MCGIMYTGDIIRLPNNYHNLENNTDLIFIDRVSMLVFPKYDQYNHTCHTWQYIILFALHALLPSAPCHSCFRTISTAAFVSFVVTSPKLVCWSVGGFLAFLREMLHKPAIITL